MSRECPRIDEKATFSEERLTEYATIIGEREIEELFQLGESLRGIRLQQINSARCGGGVAEMMRSLIPFERGLGLDVSWEVMTAQPEFFTYTKTLHNFLQGKPKVPDLVGTKVYWDTNSANYSLVRKDADAVCIHDPQPAGLIKFAPAEDLQHQKWIWRCHIHLSHEYHFVLDFMRTLIEAYDLSIFSTGKFLPPWNIASTVVLPYIDPLSEKNKELPPEQVREICWEHGLENLERKPLLTLVSRFDPFKGQQYAIEAFKLVRKEAPCQLLMVGGTASDDPENEAIFAQLQEQVKDLPDVHLLNLPPDSYIEINAFQRAASIVLQPSIKEGFGLTVSEGMWKEKPVIGGDVGGIPGQITDGYNGFLVSPSEDGINEMAQRIKYLLLNPYFAREMGKRGKEAVRERFLITRGVKDELRLVQNLCRL